MGRTILRSRLLRRWVHILSVYKHLFHFQSVHVAMVLRRRGDESGFERGNTNHDQPLRLLDTVLIPLGISQRLDFHVLGFLDFVGSSVADEDGLASPFDDNLFPSVFDMIISV